MSYPRNSASPPTINVGEIYQLSDGAIQTSGVSVRVKIGTGSFAAGSGALACDTTSGEWYYTPTQSETNAETFIVTIYKASCTSASITVSTSASETAGYVGTDHGKIVNAGSTVALSGTTIAKSPATLDWDADVSNKPTIGTSTFDPAIHKVSLAAQVITDLFGDADATQLLADFLDGVAEKFDAVDDTAVAIIATKTITDLLANATFAQLIADAAAAKASAASAATAAGTASTAASSAAAAASAAADILGDITEDNAGTARITEAALALAPGGEGTVQVSVSATAVQAAAANAGGRLNIATHSTYVATITGLGSLAGATDVIFTLKGDVSDTDDDAWVQISKNAGLLRVMGDAASDSELGSLVVTDTSGSVRLTIDASVCEQLEADEETRRPWSIKLIDAEGDAFELTSLRRKNANVFAVVYQGITRRYEATA